MRPTANSQSKEKSLARMLVRDLFFQGAEDTAVALFAEGFAVFEEYWFMNGQREFVAVYKP